MSRTELCPRVVESVVCLLLASGLAETTAANGCADCHRNPDFYVQSPKLHAYYQDWLTSPHNTAGLTCDECHGGDPSADDIITAHRGVLPPTDVDSKLFYRRQPATCGACHKDNQIQFESSKHYKALMGELVAPTCTTCHRAMSRRPYYRDIVLHACRTCHNEENVDRIPLVAERAEEILHRLNVAKGYLGWTHVYFESEGWPGQSREEIETLETLYSNIVSGVHGFDLANSDDDSIALLTQLKVIFQRAWDERESRIRPERPDDG